MIPDYMDRKHDYSFARDRQLQNKLLAADDIFDQAKLILPVSVNRPGNIRDSVCEVTGWCPKDKALRRPENDNFLPKPRTSVGTREGLLTRDRSKRDLHDSTFTFYHYPESHRYIEQYRREHTCTDSTNSATTRNEFLELQRFYAYRSQSGSLYTHPTAVGYMPPSQMQTYTVPKRDSNIGQYRSSEPSLIRSTSRYKLSPSLNVRSDPDLSREGDHLEHGPLQVGANAGSTTKMAIHAVSKTPIPKVPAKVTVPASQSQGLNKTVRAGRKTGSPKTTVAAWENGVGAMRTLDTLACVARPGEKAEEITANCSSPLPELIRTPRAQEEKKVEPGVGTPQMRSDSENSDRASFDHLSTACLAAEMSLKPRPRLEPSCTYHVFPGEDMLMDTPTLFTSSMLWNPAKSTLDRRTSQVLQFDPGLNNPFKNNLVSQMPVKVPDKEQMVKEFINDLKPLNFSLGSGEAPKTEILQKGLRGSSTKPDLPSTFELQGVSRTGRPVTQQEPRARRGKGKLRHRDGDRKSQSAHSISTETDNSSSSRSLRQKHLERDSQDGPLSDGLSAQHTAMPYFKFWNSSLSQRLKPEALPKQDTPRNGEMNLRKIAELMLNNEELPDGELEELIRRRANQSSGNTNRAPSIASGVNRGVFFSTGDAPSSDHWTWSSEPSPPQTPPAAAAAADDPLSGNTADTTATADDEDDAQHAPSLPPPHGDSPLPQHSQCPPDNVCAPERQPHEDVPQSRDGHSSEGSSLLPQKVEEEEKKEEEEHSLPADQSNVPQPHSAAGATADCTQTAAGLSSKSSVRTDSLSPSLCNTVNFKTEIATHVQPSVPIRKVFSADNVRTVPDDAVQGSPSGRKSEKVLPSRETLPGKGEEKWKERGKDSTRSAVVTAKAQGEKAEKKGREVLNCIVSEDSLQPLSVLSVKFPSPSADKKEGGPAAGSGDLNKRSQPDRRETLRLAPTRTGLLSMDRAGGRQRRDDREGSAGEEESVDQDDDLSSDRSGSLNSSLEVGLPSPEDTERSPNMTRRENVRISQPLSGGGLEGKNTGHKNTHECNKPTNSRSDSSQCHPPVHGAKKGSHNWQQTFNVDRDENAKVSTPEYDGLHHHQVKRRNMVDLMGGKSSFSAGKPRKDHHEDTPGYQGQPRGDRRYVSAPIQLLNPEKYIRKAPAPPAADAGHTEGELSHSQNPLHPGLEREQATQEKLVLLHTKQQISSMPVYHPNFSQAQQRISSPRFHVADIAEESQPKKGHQNTHPQAATCLNELGLRRSRTCVTFSKPEAETITFSKQEGEAITTTTTKPTDVPGLGRISRIRSSRPTTTSSKSVERAKTAVDRTASIPICTVTGHKLASPRKGVPLPRSHRNCMLVYHDDMDKMMVVGSDCAHRPRTTPSAALMSLKTALSNVDLAQKSKAPSPRPPDKGGPEQGEGARAFHTAPPSSPVERSEVAARSKVVMQVADGKAESFGEKTVCDHSEGTGGK